MDATHHAESAPRNEPMPTVELHGVTDAKQGSRVLFKVTPSIAGKTITLDIENSLGATAGFSVTLTRKFLDTEDRAIRAALVALGWTPPPHSGPTGPSCKFYTDQAREIPPPEKSEP